MVLSRQLLLMGILSRLFGCDSRSTTPPIHFAVDLTRFRCNTTALGEAPTPSDGYHDAFDQEGVFRDPSQGVELGVENERLDYVFLTLTQFQGKLLADGKELAITSATRQEDVLKLLGEPYWRDEDAEEVILFYEDGRVELQFEFPGQSNLGFITLMLSPILADPEQRKAYGVTKTWPPTGTIKAGA